ncbi:T9SS type A sorting domain-containing protein [Mariniflexile jejuense]|uniref:T9SS type A sorting domain-containing protein n=1 Tax=Mariniflexile jejuense TaxID=1173582 RepID=A0ABW3JFH6_9FLAO
MKKIITSILFLFFLTTNAQIGNGWDWAFNTGTLGGANMKHMKYTADGSEILFGGTGLAAAYFGSTTLTAPPQSSYPGNIKFFGKINASTGVPTVIRSFSNLPINFDCITTDAAGNFYIGGAISDVNPVDLGNGVSVSGVNKSVIAKFDASGNTLWANTFAMGTTGYSQTNILKLAVAPSGNVFFWGFNPNSDANSKRNSPLYKLDSNGNTIWYRDALNSGYTLSNVNSEFYLADKFIDNNENVYLFVYTTGTAGYSFDGVAHPGGSSTYGGSTFITLNAAGTVTKTETFDGSVKNFQVNPSTGNLVFRWNQGNVNGAPFANLPNPKAIINAYYANTFSGMVATDKDLNFIKAKDYSTISDNPFQINENEQTVLALPNGKLIFANQFYKNALPYSAGVDYLYPTDATKSASGIVETDTNWNIAKFISGGKAPSISQNFLAAYNDTYLLAATFYAEDVANPTSNPPLPTTSYGTVNLTGFNASPDITTAYGTYSTSSGLRKDVAFVQTKSSNFPMIASTTWLGNSTNWNDVSNWSNGIPTNNMKAVFNQPTSNYPTVSTLPTAASIQVNSGISLSLPSTLALTGSIKNEGAITVNNAGFFQGFGAKEWKGSGSVNFTGTQASLFFPGLFENSLVLNTNLTTFYDLKVPTITFNSGKINLNNKKTTITNPNTNAITGANSTNYFYGGKLERYINPTGVYEFPLGDNSKTQSVVISANNMLGVNSLTATYTNGSITGTTPNTVYNGTPITSALNGGWFSVTPNQQPTGGSYDVTLNIQNSSNISTSLAEYIVIKRTDNTAVWEVQGGYNLATLNASIVSIKNTNLTSFSDFAIGKGISDITLKTEDFISRSIVLFPNPTSNSVTVTSNEKIKSIDVYNFLGKQIFKQSVGSTNLIINLSNYPSGIYFFKIQSENGKIVTNKVIKN